MPLERERLRVLSWFLDKPAALRDPAADPGSILGLHSFLEVPHPHPSTRASMPESDTP